MKGPVKDPVLRATLRVTLLFVLGDVILDLLLNASALSGDGVSPWVLTVSHVAKDLLLGAVVGSIVYVLLRREARGRTAFEATLTESEERYRLLFESSIDGILLTAPDGSILAANPAACRMLGRSEAEICRAGRSGLVDPSDGRLSGNLTERAALGGATGELRLVRKDGTTFPAEVSSGLFTDREGNPRSSMIIRDITRRKQAQEALAASEERLSVLVKGVPAILWTTDTDLRYTSIQGANLVAIGIKPEQMLGKRVAEVQPGTEDEVKHVLDMHRRALAGESVNYETSWRERHYQSLIEPLRGADGAVCGCIAVTLDITARKRTEEALRASETRFRTVFEGAPIGIALETADGYILEANPALETMLGFSRAELLSMRDEDYARPSAALPDGELSTQPMDGGAAPDGMTRQYYRKDGQMRWSRVTTALTPDGVAGAYYKIVMSQDITEQLAAYRLLEQRVAERTRELSGLLEISQTIASTLDPTQLLGLILDQLKRMVDYTSASLFTCDDGDTLVMEAYRGAVPSEPAAQFRIVLTDPEARRAVLRQTEPLIISDLQDGSPLSQWARQAIGEHLLVSAADIRAVMWIPLVMKHEIIGGMGITHAEPGYYNERHGVLAQAIANQAASAIANARLFERAQGLAAMQERQRLARDLHDSLTQSLYSLTLLAEAATRQAQAGNQDMVQGYVSRIGQTAQQSLKEMRLLVYELRPAALSQDGLTGALQQRLDAVEGHTNINARLEVEGNLPPMPAAVEEGLYGIAQEALNNAIKHASATRVTVRLFDDGGSIHLEISDNGRGCDPDSPGRGGGLGLNTMAERAAMLGGTLNLQSIPGSGTTVAVTLPASAFIQE